MDRARLLKEGPCCAGRLRGTRWRGQRLAPDDRVALRYHRRHRGRPAEPPRWARCLEV